MLGAVQAALLACGAAAPPTTWDLTVQTTGSSQDYVVDINAGTTPNININWGDGGAVENFTSTGQKAHTYTNAGTYTVKISGSFASGGNIRLGSNSSNRSRLKGTKAVCNIVGLSNFSSTFYGCTGLTSLPTDLFRYNTAVSSSGFYATFYNCTSLTSIPTDLFRYNTAVSSSGFYRTFQNCTGLTSLPTDLFRYNTAVSSSGFYRTFHGCTGLTSLPTDLFRYNTAVSSSGFYRTFHGCTGLTSLPTDLFRYNTAVSSSGFYRTFHGCTKLQLSPYIFFSAGEESTRFLNRVSNFQECFYLTSFSGSQGTAPALWNCDFGTGTPTKTDCFQGHSSSSLSNWANIPADWT